MHSSRSNHGVGSVARSECAESGETHVEWGETERDRENERQKTSVFTCITTTEMRCSSLGIPTHYQWCAGPIVVFVRPIHQFSTIELRLMIVVHAVRVVPTRTQHAPDCVACVTRQVTHRSLGWLHPCEVEDRRDRALDAGEVSCANDTL
jgi:hypothetical protein